MKYTYLDYLAEHKIRFYNAVGIIVFFSLFSLIVVALMLSQRDLHSHNVINGKVSYIKMDTVLRKSEALYSSHNVKKSILVISIDDKKFILGGQYGEYREKLLSEINSGDTLKLFYKVDTYNQLMPLQIEKNDEIIFPFSYFLNIGTEVLTIAIVVFIITFSIVIILVFKRLRFLKN